MRGHARVVYEFKKNAHDSIVASVSLFRGVSRYDLRVWTSDAGGTHDVPTRKGLNLDRGQLLELRDAVDALIAAAEAVGHYGVSLLLETCLADKLTFVERTQRFLRDMIEEKVAERAASASA